MTTTVVLPCYNPQPEWEQNIILFYDLFLQSIKQEAELIIVFDGQCPSVTDESIALLHLHFSKLKIIRYAENMGKGYALRQGIAAATGDIIIYTDVDFPYTTESMITVYSGLFSGSCDVAIGVKDTAYFSHVPPVRRLVSKTLHFLIRTFMRVQITDTQCGLKGFRKEVAPLFLQTTINRYLFDLEFVRLCYKSKKYRIHAIPVSLKENVHFRRMNYKILLPEMLNFVKLFFKR